MSVSTLFTSLHHSEGFLKIGRFARERSETNRGGVETWVCHSSTHVVCLRENVSIF